MALQDDLPWLVAPAPAAMLWRDGEQVRWRLNAAAHDWVRGSAITDEHWQAWARSLLTADAPPAAGTAQPGRGAIGPLQAAWTVCAWGDRRLVWLQPQTVGATPAEQLALLRSFGRIGLFERDIASDRGQWDATMFRLFGIDPAQGAPDFATATARVHPDDAALVRRWHEEFIADPGPREVRYRLLLPGGRERAIHSRLDVQAGPDGRPVRVLGVVVDDTESALRLHAQEARATALARAIELAGVSVWHYDLAEGLFHFNAVGNRAMGLAADAPGISVDAVRATVHPDDLAAVVQAAEDALKRNGPVDVAARYRNPDGSWRHLLTRRIAERDASGQVVALVGISIDQTREIAVRARTESALRREKERLAMATGAAGAGIWERDLDGRTTYWNEQMYRLRGLAPDDPRPVDELARMSMDPQQRAELLQLAERHMREGVPYERELRLVWPDGSEHWVASVGQVLRDEQGRPLRMTGVNWDITQRRLADAALRDKETAERASRAKSEFLARMSHELRTPLNAVLGFAQLIERDADADLSAVQLERVGRIRAAGAHLLALIEDVLDLASIESGTLPLVREAVSVDAALDEVRQWVAPLAARRDVRLHWQPGGAWVRADPRRLRQVLANLLTNAVKYNRAGGSVRVDSSVEQRAGVAGRCITLRDTGRGLSDDQLAHLFEPFNRLGAERDGVEGVGIGLMIVRHLVQFMGGEVEVSSELGVGSEFRLWLPAAEAPPLQPAALLAQPAAAPASGAAVDLKVLYIEDNPVNVLLVEELVSFRPAVQLRSAVDGGSGTAAARDWRPDLVLVDMQLPDFDGFEVLRRLRAEPALSATRMIALSANAMPMDVAHARAAGFDDYWTKPIDFERFLGGLDALIAQRGVVS